MTGLEYTVKKTAIVESHTKMTFLPKGQIVDVEVTPDMVHSMIHWTNCVTTTDKCGKSIPLPMNTRENRAKLLSGGNCLYCSIYKDSVCTGCPVALAGNHCFKLPDSTYNTTRLAVMDNAIEDIEGLQLKLIDLADRFIEAHKYKIGGE